MIKYSLLEQKHGIINDPSPIDIISELIVEIENAADFKEPMTLKIVSDAEYYFAIKDGQAVVPSKNLVGDIKISVITSVGTFNCTGLTAIKNGNGTLTVVPNYKELLKRLNDVERYVSDTLNAYRALEAKYDGLASRIDKLFSQNYY